MNDSGSNDDKSGFRGEPDLPWSEDDLAAISGMNQGDFGPVAALLRTSPTIHLEVRMLLAEFLERGNERGKLKFIRGRGRPLDTDSSLVRIANAHKAVMDYQAAHPDVGVTEAIRAVAENERPFRSYEAVRSDYYWWNSVLAGIEDKHPSF